MNLHSKQNDSVLTEEQATAGAVSRRKKTVKPTFFGAVNVLLIAVAVALLIASFLFPVLMISGDSMEPGLNDGDLILLTKTHKLNPGDLVSFRWKDKTLLKRIIASPGDWVMLDGSGRVYVNGVLLDEPYVTEFGLGENDVLYPFQVPEQSYFVMGDNRIASVDSRSSHVGCVTYDQIIGKGVMRIWPPG